EEAWRTPPGKQAPGAEINHFPSKINKKDKKHRSLDAFCRQSEAAYYGSFLSLFSTSFFKEVFIRNIYFSNFS
ncbi:hypothetical protein ACFYKX_00005, partial [Cytobacillus sp. FJAT-54145]